MHCETPWQLLLCPELWLQIAALNQRGTARDIVSPNVSSSSLLIQRLPLYPADDLWAVVQLSVDGEDPVGLVQLPQYLLLARCLLLKPLGEANFTVSSAHQ